MKGFSVYNPDYNGVAFIHSETASKARYFVLRLAWEVYPSWNFMNLKVKREKGLDDKPITPELLEKIGANFEDRFQHSCRCDLCKTVD